MADLTREQKKQLAKHLYLSDTSLTQKEVAQRINCREATICKWVKEEKWAELRTSLLTTRGEQLSIMYRQLQAANDAINNREDETKRFPSSKEADAILKLTASIRNLEQETNIADKMEVGKQFLAYVRRTEAIEKAKEICRMFDSFIKSIM